MRLYLSFNLVPVRGASVKKLFNIVPLLVAFYAQMPAQAQDSTMQAVPDATGSTTNSTAAPALNVLPATVRPPVPPPPETPQQNGFKTDRGGTLLGASAQASMPQAWRLKALQLFKSNNSLDKNSICAVRLQANYDSAFESIRGALDAAGLKMEALSLSSGHILVSRPNERGTSDRAVISLRQAALDSDSLGSASATDVRVFCDSRNRSLTLTQIKALLGQVDSSIAADGKDKAGAQNL